MHLTTLIFILALFGDVSGGVECPVEPPCICLEQIIGKQSQFVVECQNLGMFNFPLFKANSTIKIDRLSFNANYIRQIPERAFGSTRPTVIDLSNNEISYIHKNAFSGVERYVSELRIASNALMSWPDAGISRLSALEKIDLSQNPGVGNFERDSFKGLENLREISIGSCRRQLYIHQSALNPLKKLKKITIKSCSIDRIPTALKNLSNLEYLDLSSNFIYKVPPNAFLGLKNLKSLRLGLNLLENNNSWFDDSFNDLENLIDLHMDNCGISTIPTKSLRPLKKLKKLVLSGNNIKITEPSPFRHLESLDELILDNNPIRYSADLFSGLEDTLRYISVKNQRLSKLPNHSLRPLRVLETIEASDNEIKYIQSDFVEGLSSWRYRLERNLIERIDRQAFYEKPSSRRFELFLFSNKIKSLKFITNPDAISLVNVSQNSIGCDCQTYGLTKIATLLVTGTCKSPVKNEPIGGVDFNTKMFFKCLVKNNTDDNKLATSDADIRFDNSVSSCVNMTSPSMQTVGTTTQVFVISIVVNCIW